MPGTSPGMTTEGRLIYAARAADGNSALVASRAPSTSESSFAQQIDGVAVR